MMQSLIAALLMALMLGLTAAPALAVHIECLAGTAACRGTQQGDVMAGTLGADKMRGLGDNDTLMALEGEDELYGGRQDDTLRAGDGVDRLLGEVGDDKLHGGQGGDTIFGNGGEDVLYGEGGDDRLVATPDVSNDRVYCGPGYDTAIVGYNDTPFACEEVFERYP